MPVLEFPGALATAAPASAVKAADPMLCTFQTPSCWTQPSAQLWLERRWTSAVTAREVQAGLSAGQTTPCTAEPRCERSHTVRTGHKRHTNALKSRFGYFAATVKEGERSILSNNLLDSECLVYFTQHASPNMCPSQPCET